MKRLCALLVMLCLLTGCALAEPAPTPAPLTGAFDGYISGGGALIENIDTPIQYQIMTKDGDNVLLVLRQRGGVWETDAIGGDVLRHGDPPSITPESETAFSISYYGDDTERYEFSADGTGEFYFRAYRCDRADGTGLRIDFASPNELRYSETHADGSLTMTMLSANIFYLALDAFDAATFPITMAEAVAFGAPQADTVTTALVRQDPALGDNEYQIPDQILYDEPDGGIAGWYFAGTEATVLDDADPEWMQVQIGNMTGWFRREAVALGVEQISVTRRPPSGMVRESYYGVGKPFQNGLYNGAAAGFYAQPDEASQVISTHCTEVGDLMQVLGILPGGWLHAVNAMDNIGYIRLLWVNQCADPWCEYPRTRLVAVVLNPDPADRLNLRAFPGEDADSYGKYYSGTKALALFEPQHHEGWRYVRIGDQDGYMMEEYLRYPADWDVGYQPPVAKLRRNALQLRQPEADAAPVRDTELPVGTQVNVLGTVSDQWYYVQAEPDVLGWDGFQGWVPVEKLTRVGPATAN